MNDPPFPKYQKEIYNSPLFFAAFSEKIKMWCLFYEQWAFQSCQFWTEIEFNFQCHVLKVQCNSAQSIQKESFILITFPSWFNGLQELALNDFKSQQGELTGSDLQTNAKGKMDPRVESFWQSFNQKQISLKKFKLALSFDQKSHTVA